jgi:hypothetical protein
MPPSGDPTAPLGTQLPPQAHIMAAPVPARDSGPRTPQLPPSGPQFRESSAPLPRWPPPPHGHVGRLRWWLAGGVLLGLALLVLVLVSRSETSTRVIAPPPADSVLIVATTPDAELASDAEAVAIDAAVADASPAASDAAIASDAAPSDASEPDEMAELDKPMPKPTQSKKKLRTKAELNGAFRERRYKDIVVACSELGADGEIAVVCTLAACRARDGRAQDWYRNVAPNKRDGTINICKQSGAAITDVCATDLMACRK